MSTNISDMFPGDEDPVPVVPVVKTPLWEDFVDIFYAPSSVFARRTNANFWPPLLMISVLIGIIFLAAKGVMQPLMDAEFTRAMAVQMKKNPQITPEALASMRGIQDKIASVVIFVITPIIIMLTGILLWVVGKIVDAKQMAGTAIIVATYAYIPKVLESVINSVQAVLADPADLTSRFKLQIGPARFLDPDNSSLYLQTLLGNIDVFSIWVAILLTIGLSVTGKIPLRKAAIGGFIMWLLFMVPGLLGALRS